MSGKEQGKPLGCQAQARSLLRLTPGREMFACSDSPEDSQPPPAGAGACQRLLLQPPRLPKCLPTPVALLVCAPMRRRSFFFFKLHVANQERLAEYFPSL